MTILMTEKRLIAIVYFFCGFAAGFGSFAIVAMTFEIMGVVS